MLIDYNQTTIIQTLAAPIQSLEEITTHFDALSELVKWNSLGIFYDEEPNTVLVLMLNDDAVIAVCRFCLSVSESVSAMTASGTNISDVIVRCCQGHTLTGEEITDLSKLENLWSASVNQSEEIALSKIDEFFKRIEENTKSRGRGKNFSADTIRQVLFDAHGRCMFEGCATDLTIDPITGTKGNYAYLAHNVAASESGPRGILYLSEVLADEPENILLLCDIHHRLVDTIAKPDFPATKLSEMRGLFCTDATTLLDGLKMPSVPVFFASWPVHRQPISAPTSLQLSQSLADLGLRSDGPLRVLNNNDTILKDADPEQIWNIMPNTIVRTADQILAQSQSHSYRAALYAIGLMPTLVALGALLGNKSEITPMLRYRENGLWYWPKESTPRDFYTITGVEDISSDDTEVVLELAFTARPNSMAATSTELKLPIVKVEANDEFKGNGALSNPDDGKHFRQKMQELMHTLRDEHGIQKVHLLPCASNAACVFFGQSYDSYHPELVIYDFQSDGEIMTPRLVAVNEDNKCEIKSY